MSTIRCKVRGCDWAPRTSKGWYAAKSNGREMRQGGQPLADYQRKHKRLTELGYTTKGRSEYSLCPEHLAAVVDRLNELQKYIDGERAAVMAVYGDAIEVASPKPVLASKQ